MFQINYYNAMKRCGISNCNILMEINKRIENGIKWTFKEIANQKGIVL